MKYIKELDSLRALAVLGVICSHWMPNTFAKIPLGAFGVHFFFILSGFLISKILFESRIKYENQNASNWTLIKNFYVRRSLRIFPIYYLSIFIYYIFKKYTFVDFDTSLVYCLTYTTNFYFFKIGNWQGIISPLWSLAVEEQFYLIWPWFMIFINKKYLLQVIGVFIFVGIFSEYFYTDIPKGDLLPNTCFAGFGLGALFAWVLVFKKEYLTIFSKVAYYISVIAAMLVVLILSKIHLDIPIRFLTSLASLGLLTYVVLNAGKDTLKLKFIFRNPMLLFFGKISYGIYLYHSLVPTLVNDIFLKQNLNPYLPTILTVKYFKWFFFIENFFLLILISWVSYHLIEKKILAFKIKYD